MKRRDFLKATTAAAAAAFSTPHIRPARAQGRNDTLLTLSESGPNNLDIMGVGTNRPGYEASWNTHDRLVTFGSKPDANGIDHYDFTKIEPELAEPWICATCRRFSRCAAAPSSTTAPGHRA